MPLSRMKSCKVGTQSPDPLSSVPCSLSLCSHVLQIGGNLTVSPKISWKEKIAFGALSITLWVMFFGWEGAEVSGSTHIVREARC